MTTYEHLKPGLRTPWDAVIVTVSELLGRTVADVAAVEEIASLPVPVRQALDQAEQLRSRMGLKRVVVRMEDARLWNPAWGQLIELDG